MQWEDKEEAKCIECKELIKGEILVVLTEYDTMWDAGTFCSRNCLISNLSLRFNNIEEINKYLHALNYGSYAEIVKVRSKYGK